MDFVTHWPRTSRGHDTVWVIMDRLTKSANFLAVRMIFTLDEFCRLYIREIVRLHGVPVSVVSDWDPMFTAHFLGEFLSSHGNTVDDDQCFSSSYGRSVRDDHPDFRGHVTGTHLGF